MKLSEFEYAEPKSIRKACQLLQQRKGRAQAIAGGTALMTALKNRLNVPEMLVDLKVLPHLNQIRYSEKEGLKLGAMVSLRQLAHHAVVKENYPVLVQAASMVGTVQLQAMGTVGGNLCQDNLCLYYNRSPILRQSLGICHKLGGNICHVVSRSKDCWATYCGDIAPVLLVLQAKIHLLDSRGMRRRIPLEKFYSGDGKKPNLLKPGQILTEIEVPAPSAHSGGVYLKLRQRKAIDYPLLGVAVHLTMGKGREICQEAALALTAVGRAPLLVKEGANLKGKKLNEEVIESLAEAAHQQAHPLSNICELTPKYRKEMVRHFVKLAIQQALQRIVQGGEAA